MGNDFFNNRFKIFKDVKKGLGNRGHVRCVEKDDTKVHVIKRIGTSSVFGEAYLTNYLTKKKNLIVLKKSKPTSKDTEFMYGRDEEKIRKSFFNREITVLSIVTKLVERNICHNLPIMYDYFLCDDCEIMNKEISWTEDIQEIPCLMILAEYANGGDAKHFLTEKNRPFGVWINMIFQIFVGIYVLHKMGIVHRDLHWGNVLIHNIEKGGVFEYVINKKKYVIPNMGFVFVIWDFGKAKSIELFGDYITQKDYIKDYHRVAHYSRWAESETYEDIVVPSRIRKISNYILQLENVEDFIQIIYKHIRNGNNNSRTVIKSSNLDKLK